jgi:peptidoglycan/xylan/chitin deacetylase (PgdA/CDA1 family)
VGCRRAAVGSDDYDPVVGTTLVLCYHGVSAAWPEGISPSRLRAHVGHMLGRGHRAVSFSDAVLASRGRVFSVTFDDGYRSVVERALPVLDELGVTASVFVPTDFIGGASAVWPGTDHWLGTPHADELCPMSWDDLRLLIEHGWEVGSHSCSHARLVQLADTDLNDELAGSRTELENQLATSCTTVLAPSAPRCRRSSGGCGRRERGMSCVPSAGAARPETVDVNNGPVGGSGRPQRRALPLAPSRVG